MRPWTPQLISPCPLVFTDLDGTLLDHDNYSHEAANTALAALETHNVPVIPVTSKTCAELLQLRKQLNNTHPFIVENGAAIYIPSHYFEQDVLDKIASNSEENTLAISKIDASFYVFTLGRDREHWIKQLGALPSELQSAFISFSELGTEGIAKHTDLPSARANLANQREASEPLLWQGDSKQLEQLQAIINEMGGQVLRGGRFVHILDQQAGKGRAVEKLLQCYQAIAPNHATITAALGDADNDIAMLEVADHPIVIRSAHREPPNTQHINNVTTSTLIGPAGWQETMSDFLGTLINPKPGVG